MRDDDEMLDLTSPHWLPSHNVRLIKAIPKTRLCLISGDSSKPPSVGDFGQTDQRYSDPGGPMVLVYFESDGGRTEWEAEAYEAELEPLSGN